MMIRQAAEAAEAELVVGTCEDADALHAEHGGDKGATRPPDQEDQINQVLAGRGLFRLCGARCRVPSSEHKEQQHTLV
jgi:hypothetical protein